MGEVQALALQVAALQADMFWVKTLLLAMLLGQGATGLVLWRQHNNRGPRT